MSELASSFTFRLTPQDKVALANLAERLGCDRGVVLRRFIRQSSADLSGPNGQFAANGYVFPLRLSGEEAPVEGVE